MSLNRATYVKSINGYTGTRPFTGEDGIVFKPEAIPNGDSDVKVMLKPEIKTVTLDAGDVHITGGSGATIPTKAQSIAQNVQMLEMQTMETVGDFRIRIGNYPLVTVIE